MFFGSVVDSDFLWYAPPKYLAIFMRRGSVFSCSVPASNSFQVRT